MTTWLLELIWKSRKQDTYQRLSSWPQNDSLRHRQQRQSPAPSHTTWCLSQETLPCPCALSVTLSHSGDKERFRDEMFSEHSICGMLDTPKLEMEAACRAQHLLWTRVQSREPPPSRGFQQVPEAAAALSERGVAHRDRWQEPLEREDCQGQMSVTALCKKIYLRNTCEHLINCLSLIHPVNTIVLSQVCFSQKTQRSLQYVSFI